MTLLATSSLRARLLAASVFIVPLFLGGTGWYLQKSYERSLESAVQERLQLQVLTLMAEADFEEALTMPAQLLEARFNQINSGLFGIVSNQEGTVLWRSPSSVASDLAPLERGRRETLPGEQGFAETESLYHYWYSVLWQTESGEDIPLVFSVLETTRLVQTQLASLRSSLFLWLGGATVALLLLQSLILLWGLKPLRRLAGDIADIEAGKKESLGGEYPMEVQPLTENLNSLILAEHQRRERTRNTLADLAHSLKTPLAVIRSADAQDGNFANLVADQTDQMEQIVAYQLQRASSGSHNLLRLVPVISTAQRLQKTLAKVYADKSLNIALEIPGECHFRGEERDLMELLGTLMDNAGKYGNENVRVSTTGSDDTLTIAVEDDGPGIPLALRDTLITRGARADSSKPGHGIGLAVAKDIAISYGGRLTIEGSPLGGAKVSVFFCGQ